MEWNAGLSTLFVDNLKLKMSRLQQIYHKKVTKFTSKLPWGVPCI